MWLLLADSRLLLRGRLEPERSHRGGIAALNGLLPIELRSVAEAGARAEPRCHQRDLFAAPVWSAMRDFLAKCGSWIPNIDRFAGEATRGLGDRCRYAG